MTITERIAARLDAMEAAARAAYPSPWIAANGEVFTANDDDPEEGPTIWVNGGIYRNQRVTADHIALNDPAAVLALVDGLRAVVADIVAEKHAVVEDCWYTCAAATEDRDGGETCNDSNRGTGCDCGRDARANRRLTALAAALDPVGEGSEGAEAARTGRVAVSGADVGPSATGDVTGAQGGDEGARETR